MVKGWYKSGNDSGGDILQGQGKVMEFHFDLAKIDIAEKCGKLGMNFTLLYLYFGVK